MNQRGKKTIKKGIETKRNKEPNNKIISPKLLFQRGKKSCYFSPENEFSEL